MKRNYLNELLLAIYIFLFILIRPVLSMSGGKSTLILFTIASAIIIISLMYSHIINKEKISKYKVKAIVFYFYVILIIVIDLLFRYNNYLFRIIYDFIVYGIIPVYLFVQVKYYDKFIEYYSKISILTFAIYFLDPFNKYYFSKGYMTFGFSAMLPSFIGIYILSHKSSSKIIKIIKWVSFIEIALFGNKGAFLCAFIFIGLYDLCINKKSKRKFLKYIIILTAIIIIILNIENILKNLISILEHYNYYSYSLRSFYNVILENSSGLSGRELLWDDAMLIIQSHPILGQGIGLYESMYNGYSHNLILDIGMSYGIIGLMVLTFILLNGVRRYIANKGNERLIYIIFLSLSIPKLMFSSYFYGEMSFWILIFICIFGTFKNCERKEVKYESAYRFL